MIGVKMIQGDFERVSESKLTARRRRRRRRRSRAFLGSERTDMCRWVPVLQTPDGAVFESNAIARCVSHLKADNPLNGSSLIEYAQIEQWIDFSTLEPDVHILTWLQPRIGRADYIKPVEEAAIAAVKRALEALNTHLASRTYLVGHAVTLADIVLTCNLQLGFTLLLTKSFTSEYPHVERYFWTMVNQPNYLKVIGEVKQTEAIPPIQSTKKPAQLKDCKT
ncbi:hypothetical protein Droror1_Dr00021662 [Drosera rotundifolia]